MKFIFEEKANIIHVYNEVKMKNEKDLYKKLY